MKRVLLYVLIMVASFTMVMCTPAKETPAENNSTEVEAVDTVEAKSDTTVVAVDSTEVQ